MSLEELTRDCATPASESGALPNANAIERCASRLFINLIEGRNGVADAAEIASALEAQAFAARAERFHRKLSDRDQPVLERLENMASAGFEEFAQCVARPMIGAVFTAHPTFSMSRERRALFAKFGDADGQPSQAEIRHLTAGPPPNISLDDEHEDVLQAIAAARQAFRAMSREILNFAQRRFPATWRRVRPHPFSLATWVGYDIDGRTDIHWSKTVAIRLREKSLQLDDYARSLRALNDARPCFTKLCERFEAAAALSREHAALFERDLNDTENLVAAANALTAEHPARLIGLRDAIEKLEGELKTLDDGDALKLLLLISEMRAFGLGVARIHLRVNAAQVRSALKHDLGLDPDTDFKGRMAMDIAADRANDDTVKQVNFGSLFRERMTARRQFMLCAQILKHIDAEAPIRFLIAECEAPATVMGAVFLARYFGVEKSVDISPLFETPSALESGGRFLERLIDAEAFRDYARARGRIAIQIGYSDSGRFMGQLPASMAAERLQILFARAIARSGLDDIEAVIFNTHGESMGRGGHSGSIANRLDHVMTPWSRRKFVSERIAYVNEVSFQGGDGYLFFQSGTLAETTLMALWAHAMAPPDHRPDSFYTDINLSWDFYRALKDWQETLIGRDDYKRTVFSFMQNMLPKTGSRAAKRTQVRFEQQQVRNIRAIPNNAILQQLAMPINVAGGIGWATAREPKRFLEHYERSNRMAELLRLAGLARQRTEPDALNAYAAVMSPIYWARATKSLSGERNADICGQIASACAESGAHAAFYSLEERATFDLQRFDNLFTDEIAFSSPAGAGVAQDEIRALHALRVALFAYALYLLASAPDFSRRHDIERSDILKLALSGDLVAAIDQLANIFPKEASADAVLNTLDERTDLSDESSGAYPSIHLDIVEPLRDCERALGVITAALSHHYDAFG